MGLQIMGNYFNEKMILNIARKVENNCEKIFPNL
jgi:Asp-tRNA(Asn)/Glu-tRNA(Gln) amidotransferase A subunit family amidase